jgi:DNA-binding MarR family transcriptional regulator
MSTCTAATAGRRAPDAFSALTSIQHVRHSGGQGPCFGRLDGGRATTSPSLRGLADRAADAAGSSSEPRTRPFSLTAETARPRGDSRGFFVGSVAAVVDLDTRLLRAFVTVAEELNFTRAAERLALAQQALSAQIRQLEGRLGARLFERTTRRVSLTEVGTQLLPHARATLEALDAGVGAVVTARKAAGSTLRVGLATTAVVALTAETMRRFGERHSEIELSVRNTGFFDLTGGLDGGLTDVAFVRPPFRSKGLSMVTV